MELQIFVANRGLVLLLLQQCINDGVEQILGTPVPDMQNALRPYAVVHRKANPY